VKRKRRPRRKNKEDRHGPLATKCLNDFTPLRVPLISRNATARTWKRNRRRHHGHPGGEITRRVVPGGCPKPSRPLLYNVRPTEHGDVHPRLGRGGATGTSFRRTCRADRRNMDLRYFRKNLNRPRPEGRSFSGWPQNRKRRTGQVGVKAISMLGPLRTPTSGERCSSRPTRTAMGPGPLPDVLTTGFKESPGRAGDVSRSIGREREPVVYTTTASAVRRSPQKAASRGDPASRGGRRRAGRQPAGGGEWRADGAGFGRGGGSGCVAICANPG